MRGLSPDANVVLIGMPAAGKSTVGVLLAKRLGFAFLDTDVEIQTHEGRTLQDVIDHDGIDAFREIEQRCVLDLDVRRTVVATGGSVIYGAAAVEALRRNGVVVYLEASLAVVEARLRDLSGRGLVRRRGQTLRDLYLEREPLYRAAADLTIACDGLALAQIVDRIASRLAARER